jgi:hypothetical protein
MTWANLSILGVGAALIAIPIILHFLMQPKPKEMIFPAMRFLKQRQVSNRSRMRVRHFLLLLMRCLLIGLVAVALAGPSVASNEFGDWITLGGIGVSGLIVGIILLFSLLRARANWLLVGILGGLFLGHLIYGAWAANKLLGSESAQLLGDDQAPVAALILFDTSPRMEYRHENQTRLEKAQETGQWLVSQFPDDSQVCVSATDNDRPFFSVDVAAAQRRIETLQTSFSGSSIPTSLLEGLQILEKAPQERKEIYVVTDLTRQSWAGENPKPIIKRLEKMVGASLFVVDVGVENATNFGLTRLKLSDVEINGNGRLVVTTEIQRAGPAAQRTATMTIEKHEPPLPVVRDERTLFPNSTFDGQTVTKEIRENSSVPLKFTFSDPLDLGTYHGRVEIEGQDGLEIDDIAYFTIRVGQIKKALVVHPSNVNPRVMESLLAPQDKIDAGTARFECETITQSEFQARESLEVYDVVYLLNPRPIEDSNWQRLEGFVQNGGGLGIFLGHNAVESGSAHPGFTTPAAQRVLAGNLEQPWFNEDPDLFLSPKELNHPVFRLIRNIETAVLWNRFPVFMHWGIGPDENIAELPTQVLLRFGNREPAVIERTIGSGRVLVMTTPITEYGFVEDRPSWNSLLTGNPVPAFLLLDGMASYLVQSDTASLNINVGQTAAFDNNLREYPEGYQVFSPQPSKPPTRLNTVDDQIRYRFVDHPGHYRLKGVFNQNVMLRGFSANLDPSASDLTRLEPDQLDTFLGQDRYQLARQQDEIQRQQGTTRRGQEFYPLVVLMMLVVLAVEYLMSNRFYGT